jgi:hypothetical protein
MAPIANGSWSPVRAHTQFKFMKITQRLQMNATEHKLYVCGRVTIDGIKLKWKGLEPSNLCTFFQIFLGFCMLKPILTTEHMATESKQVTSSLKTSLTRLGLNNAYSYRVIIKS